MMIAGFRPSGLLLLALLLPLLARAPCPEGSPALGPHGSLARFRPIRARTGVYPCRPARFRVRVCALAIPISNPARSGKTASAGWQRSRAAGSTPKCWLRPHLRIATRRPALALALLRGVPGRREPTAARPESDANLPS